MKSVSNQNKIEKSLKGNQTFKICIFIILLLLLFGLAKENLLDFSHKQEILEPRLLEVTTFNDIINDAPLKKILFWGKFFFSNDLKIHCIQDDHDMDFCPYKCEYSVDQNETSLRSSHAIVIHGREDPHVTLPPFRLQRQHWVFLMEESAEHSWTDISNLNNTFNWTMTHRTDSDIQFPYGSLLKSGKLYDINTTTLLQRKPVAWAASNCGIFTSDRIALVEEISKYIQVDTFGKCGKNECPSRPGSMWMCDYPQLCSELLGKSYKFYLAFENSICEDYITEKFFNSLKYDMVPVALGPSRECYEKHVPKDSFIHFEDFATVKELAEFVKYLDENDDEYLKYFDWKVNYEVDNTNYYQKAWCNLCTKLHLEDIFTGSYPSIYKWWFNINDRNVCETTKVINGTVIKAESNSMGRKP